MMVYMVEPGQDGVEADNPLHQGGVINKRLQLRSPCLF